MLFHWDFNIHFHGWLWNELFWHVFWLFSSAHIRDPCPVSYYLLICWHYLHSVLCLLTLLSDMLKIFSTSPPHLFQLSMLLSIYTEVYTEALYVVKFVGVFISGFWVLHLAEEGWATNCLQGTFISIFSCSPGPQGLGVVLSISTRDKKKKGQRRQVTYLRSHRDFGENLELELGFSESQGQATTPDSWGQWVMPLPTHSQHSW